MFEQTVDQPVVRRGLSKKGWAKYLLFYLVVSIGLILLFGHLSSKDALIAEREKIVTGTIVEIHKGKHDPTDYTFQFEGNTFQGKDSGSYLDLTVGASAKVFVDPQNPQTNGLRSFRFKSGLNHDFKTFAVYLSIALAIASAILWLRVLNSEATESDKEGT